MTMPMYNQAGENTRVIFHNGVVISMEDGQPRAEAIAIAKDTILAVGSDDEILALAEKNTDVIDLGGRTLMPGFIDSHSHWIGDREIGGYKTPDEAIEVTLRRGWTSIDEIDENQVLLDELIALDEEERLRVRVNAYLPVNRTFEKFGNWYLNHKPGFEYSPLLRIAGIKLFLDQDWGAVLYWTQEELNAYVLEAHQNGWQVASHTISIEAHDMLFNAFENALGKGESGMPYRHRVEHVVQIRDDQLERMRHLGAIASVQPTGPGDWLSEEDFVNLTADDLSWLMRWRDLMAGGVHMIGSTDGPWLPPCAKDPSANVEISFSPLGVIYQAVTGNGYSGRTLGDWHLKQTLTVEQALRLLTINGAYGTFQENVKGSLAPGKYADLVILSDNPLTVPVEKLLEIDVLMTMVGGRVEYCAEGIEALLGDLPKA